MSTFSDLDIHIRLIYSKLNKIVQELKEPLEGNCFTYHQTLREFPELRAKRENIFNVTRKVFEDKGSCDIGEVGFNAGHSALLLILASKSKAKYTFYDLNAHVYARPCFNEMQSLFPEATMKFVPGDSRETLRDAAERGEQYDVFHLDGGHAADVYYPDLRNVLKMVRTGGIIIIDDTNLSYISESIDALIKHQLIEEVEYIPTTGYPHRIVRKL
jgi:hypothetical protein